MISATYLQALNRYATARGLYISAHEAMRDADLQPGEGADPTISCIAFVALVETLAIESADEAFGMHFIESLPPRSAGVFNHIIFNSRTLREAFQAIARFLGLVTDAFQMRYEETDGIGWLIYDCPFDLGPRTQFFDGQIALIAVRARQLLGENCTPAQVDMERPEPASAKEFRRIFGILPRFNQSVNRIGYDLALLAKPLPLANHDLFTSAQNYGRQLLGLGKDERTTSKLVANYISRALQRGDATEPQACAELGMSARTLQRSLAAEGTSFKTVMEETRMQLARHYLNNTDLSLTAIAFLLGYSELSAFSRAAKHWLGESPSALRKKQRQDAN
jgi:AraC-like DNA-binding protein